ncbi:hypothetical protein FGO68_gene5638 [Halteria grandinella]|uniref:Uncharacterized protein n=1 Tax=Halteria grandinella TaxID=5974 RepID=A0A8J8NR14_HALGN|nr:hypothetical protein FGO68_gene5638 [Halteria grandinella]
MTLQDFDSNFLQSLIVYLDATKYDNCSEVTIQFGFLGSLESTQSIFEEVDRTQNTIYCTYNFINNKDYQGLIELFKNKNPFETQNPDLSNVRYMLTIEMCLPEEKKEIGFKRFQITYQKSYITDEKIFYQSKSLDFSSMTLTDNDVTGFKGKHKYADYHLCAAPTPRLHQILLNLS